MQHSFHDIAQRQSTERAQGQLEFPTLEARPPREHVHGCAAPHAEIIAPRQIQYARVVFLPVRHKEIEIDR